MTRPFRDLANVLDVGPDLSDPPQEDWGLLEELERAVAALTEKLRYEPGLTREAAALFVKLTAPEQSIHFRSLIWPQARRLAGLPARAKSGRRPGARSGKKDSDVPLSDAPARLVNSR
jgi:hypothetical protein